MAGEHAWQGGGHAWQEGMHSRGHAWWGRAWQGACIAGGMHGRGGAWQGGIHGRGGVHAKHAPQQILRDTVNERAVRILLECILALTICVDSTIGLH